ncbi:conserved protein, unknown function [Hepatocystis sp. ex Piliocolobus tephrosceles]|nr:conserved protein, unknown function [Hepatocystis sp. ex Piliocolobus tephrosceles]
MTDVSNSTQVHFNILVKCFKKKKSQVSDNEVDRTHTAKNDKNSFCEIFNEPKNVWLTNIEKMRNKEIKPLKKKKKYIYNDVMSDNSYNKKYERNSSKSPRKSKTFFRAKLKKKKKKKNSNNIEYNDDKTTMSNYTEDLESNQTIITDTYQTFSKTLSTEREEEEEEEEEKEEEDIEEAENEGVENEEAENEGVENEEAENEGVENEGVENGVENEGVENKEVEKDSLLNDKKPAMIKNKLLKNKVPLLNKKNHKFFNLPNYNKADFESKCKHSCSNIKKKKKKFVTGMHKYELPTVAYLGKAKKLNYLNMELHEDELNKKLNALLNNIIKINSESCSLCSEQSKN